MHESAGGAKFVASISLSAGEAVRRVGDAGVTVGASADANVGEGAASLGAELAADRPKTKAVATAAATPTPAANPTTRLRCIPGLPFTRFGGQRRLFLLTYRAIALSAARPS